MSGDVTPQNRAYATRNWLRGFLPLRAQTDRNERIRACGGALLGVFVTAITAYWLMGPSEYLPILVAPIGASAVLLFAVPTGPLAQPWAILGGNTVSALMGITALMLFDNVALACAAGVTGAIGAMFVLRCLHPPGGAMALTAVLGGDFVLEQGYAFAFSPVALESAILLVTGLIYNNLTGRRYPTPRPGEAPPSPQRTTDTPPGQRTGFTQADLEAVLSRYSHFIDISRSDLTSILQQTELQAYRRRMGAISCADIMSRDLITVDADTSLAAAWERMHYHRIKALPVVDAERNIIGIVTLFDFLHHADLHHHDSLHEKFAEFLKRQAMGEDGASVVGDIMTRPVETARADEHIAVLIPKLSDHGRHHIPIVDDDDRLVGIITQSDLIAALYRDSQSAE